jgi:DNA-binding transcriptional MerR regulator
VEVLDVQSDVDGGAGAARPDEGSTVDDGAVLVGSGHAVTVGVDISVRFKSEVGMRIGELARRTGVSERSLRYYEQQGLLAPSRTPGGHREYPEQSVDRVIRIQELFAAGLHSKKIARLLPCMRIEDGGPAKVATPRLVAELTAERDRIDRMMAELGNSREVLDDVIRAVGEPTPVSGGAQQGAHRLDGDVGGQPVERHRDDSRRRPLALLRVDAGELPGHRGGRGDLDARVQTEADQRGGGGCPPGGAIGSPGGGATSGSVDPGGHPGGGRGVVP